MSVSGVLLYYSFVDLRGKQREVRDWLQQLCDGLELVGRARVAEDGLNCTLGGKWNALQQHVAAIQNHQLFQSCSIDFKLAESPGAQNHLVTAESGFNVLAVTCCKEVVSLGKDAQVCSVAELPVCTGLHLSPADFHAALQRSSGKGLPPVLLDARNVYETRIGRFSVDGVEVLDPQLRCFSELPRWMDEQEEALRGRRVLMYCTGGVRCERASAYLRSKGPAFQQVAQLAGGIQRYLEAFPDGGFFKGKNFVFDERGAVGSTDPTVVGSCAACRAPWDDYGRRCRCASCRLLLLLCDCCAAAGRHLQPPLLCELCAARTGRHICPEAAAACAAGTLDARPTRRLRILCLHGFRQTAKGFQGRTAALRKKLKGIADFVYVDAPHILPFYYKALPQQQQPSDHSQPGPTGSSVQAGCPGIADPADCQDMQQPACSQHCDGCASRRASPALDAPAGCSGRCEGQGFQPPTSASSQPSMSVASQHMPSPKRAWLVSPDILVAQSALRQPSQWVAAPATVDEGQYQGQTEGWAQSWALLQEVLRTQGPFDGVLGFSQGCAAAAMLCLMQQRDRRIGPACRQTQQEDSSTHAAYAGEGSECSQQLRFAWLCSGYPSPADKHQSAVAAHGPIMLPSLHVFGEPPAGDPTADRQISAAASAALVGWFDTQQRSTVRHQCGHFFPATKAHCMRYRRWLEQFL